MSRHRKRVVDEALLVEVWGQLREGKHISEGYINGGAKERVYGLLDGNRVTINPVHSVLDTLIHELIHRSRPRWGERRVIRETTRIIRTLSDAQMRKWHRQYERVKVARKRAVELDDDEQI